MSEHDEQVYLFNALKYEENLGYMDLKWVHAIPNGGLRNKAVAGKMKAEGAKSGVWDIFVPVARQGFHGFYIEMKYGDNDLTANQRQFLAFISGQGFKTAVCYNWENAYDLIMGYLYDNPPRYSDRIQPDIPN